MSSIDINIRLRPLRFAFLVRPNNTKQILEAFRINTCLWGGKFNPIIPYFKRIPQWWERKGFKYENANQILNGYLDFFEPDFLVESERGIANGLGFLPERVLQYSDIILPDKEDRWRKKGQSVFDIYNDLYKKEYQFNRRHEHNIVNVKTEDKINESFVACIFGSFPQKQNLKYLERGFNDAFNPKQIDISGPKLSELYISGCTTALIIGHNQINVNYNNHLDPTLFVINAHEPKDLIDFWNLRTMYKSIVAVPIQWIGDLSKFCEKYIIKNQRKYPSNRDDVVMGPTILFSRSMRDHDIEKIDKKYFKLYKDKYSIQSWYPQFWRRTPDYIARTTRPTLSSKEKRTETVIDFDQPTIRFNSIFPKFAKDYGNRIRFANVVRFNDWSQKNLIATIYPTNYRDHKFPNLDFGMGQSTYTSEGFVFFPEHRNLEENWEMDSGIIAFQKWFKKSNISAKVSDAGRATQQLIQTLGGFWGVRSLANKQIIQLLDKMSRKPMTHSFHHDKFRQEINKAYGSENLRKGYLNLLVNKKAVELGLEVRCTKCSSWSWYSLDQLDYSLICNLCLKPYSFPITNPRSSNNAKWAYRVIGPFALPDYARGGYAASLAIRFFSDVLGGGMESSKITWSPGQEMTFPDGKISEVDFILWYQRKQIIGTDYPTDIVFGEAKSFGKDVFKQDDVNKMKQIAIYHPGSIIVFATLKQPSDLSPEEITRIAEFAEWGRGYNKKAKKIHAHILMFTGTELFTEYNLKKEWKEKGDSHEKLVRSTMVKIENLKTLSDLTQQLYLGLPSYFEWRQEKMEKIKLLKKRKK